MLCIQEHLDGDTRVVVRHPRERRVTCAFNIKPDHTTCAQIVRAACAYFDVVPSDYVLAYTKANTFDARTVSDTAVFDAVMSRDAVSVWLAPRPSP